MRAGQIKHDDLRIPRSAIKACRDIPALLKKDKKQNRRNRADQIRQNDVLQLFHKIIFELIPINQMLKQIPGDKHEQDGAVSQQNRENLFHQRRIAPIKGRNAMPKHDTQNGHATEIVNVVQKFHQFASSQRSRRTEDAFQAARREKSG